MRFSCSKRGASPSQEFHYHSRLLYHENRISSEGLISLYETFPYSPSCSPELVKFRSSSEVHKVADISPMSAFHCPSAK